MSCRARRTALALLVTSALAAGCGSTVGSVGASGGPVAAGLGVPLGTTAPAAPGVGDTAGGAVAGVPGSGHGGGQSRAGVVTGGTGTAGTGGNGVGVASGAGGGTTSSGEAAALTGPIHLDYTIWDQAGFTALTGNTQAGQDPAANQGSDEREMNALVAYANATGGVGGRKLAKPIGIRVSTADVTSQQTMDSYCTKATEDDHAQVFIDRSFFVSDESVSCFARHHTTLVSLLPDTGDALYAKTAPYVASTSPSVERSASAFIKGLNDAHYFQGAHVGVVLDDSPTVDIAWNRYMLPALQALHVAVKPADVVRVNTTDSSAQSSQASSAVLKFRTDGVDHVIYFSGFLGQLAFTQTADSQGYHPRYGWSDYGGDVADAGFYVSATQNANAVAVSSSGSYVVEHGDDKQPRSLTQDYNRNDKKHVSPGLRRCLDVLSKYTHVNYYSGSSGRSTEFTFYCDNFFLWLQAARNVASIFSPATWGRGLAAVGTSYEPVEVHSTDFSHRYAGADTYRVGIYSPNAACKCFPAITPWRPF